MLRDRELHFRAGVRVAQTKDRPLKISRLELFDQLVAVLPKSSEQIGYYGVGLASLALNPFELDLDRACQVLFPDSQDDLLLLGRLGQVRFESSL
jgi:hypothetical protein